MEYCLLDNTASSKSARDQGDTITFCKIVLLLKSKTETLQVTKSLTLSIRNCIYDNFYTM